MLVSRLRFAARRWSSSLASVAHWPLWIGNAAVEGSDAPLDIINPATGRAVATAACASAGDVGAAVASSVDGWAAWRDAGVLERGRVLRRAAEGLRRRLPEIVALETAHTGRPTREYTAQLARVPEWLEYHASLAECREGSIPPFGGDDAHVALVHRVPLGVCGLITPFNHPLLIATKKLAPCLATGNVAVVKAPEKAPGSVYALAEILADAGAPPGARDGRAGREPNERPSEVERFRTRASGTPSPVVVETTTGSGGEQSFGFGENDLDAESSREIPKAAVGSPF